MVWRGNFYFFSGLLELITRHFWCWVQNPLSGSNRSFTKTENCAILRVWGVETKELLKWCSSCVLDYKVCKAVLTLRGVAAMQSKRGTDYSPPLHVKVSTTKISPSKSLTNPKCRSVSLQQLQLELFRLIQAKFCMLSILLHCRALQFYSWQSHLFLFISKPCSHPLFMCLHLTRSFIPLLCAYHCSRSSC